MTSYLVRLCGRNLLVDGGDGPRKRRFSAWRLVEAGNPEKAQALAVEFIRDAVGLEVDVLNDASDPPRIDVQRVDEVHASAFDVQRRSATVAWDDEDP
mgnify:CR=1 FL=1